MCEDPMFMMKTFTSNQTSKRKLKQRVLLTVDIEQSFRTERRANMPSQQRRFAWIQLVNVCQAIQMISPSLLRVEWFRCIVIFMAMKQKFARGNHASLSISPFLNFFMLARNNWIFIAIILVSSFVSNILDIYVIYY